MKDGDIEQKLSAYGAQNVILNKVCVVGLGSLQSNAEVEDGKASAKRHVFAYQIIREVAKAFAKNVE